MKKKLSLLLLIFSILFTSCSKDSNSEIEQSFENEENTKLVDSNSKMSGICGPGYIAVWSYDVTFTLFKPFGKCANGFGFCFVRVTLSLDCQRIRTITAAYNSQTNTMKVNVEAIDDDTVRFWIHSDAVGSPDHSLSDFDKMVIGDFELTNGIVLEGGEYSKNVSGQYFYYDVPIKK